jgi:L-asparaginase/Glu-tRNA(Gln) amidotransferase subunit D
MTVCPFLPDTMLKELDGLVIAGMGTGSISNTLVTQLSPKWTELIPIVLTSRCDHGSNVDEYYYKGSLDKYVSKGFKIVGYENLTPIQARIKLILELSTTDSNSNCVLTFFRTCSNFHHPISKTPDNTNRRRKRRPKSRTRGGCERSSTTPRNQG